MLKILSRRDIESKRIHNNRTDLSLYGRTEQPNRTASIIEASIGSGSSNNHPNETNATPN